jgi:hypothetical protein
MIEYSYFFLIKKSNNHVKINKLDKPQNSLKSHQWLCKIAIGAAETYTLKVRKGIHKQARSRFALMAIDRD